MSNGIEKPSFGELLEDLKLINEINDRVNTIDLIRLKELVIQLDKMLFEKFKLINDFLILNPSYSLEHCKTHFWQYSFNYYSLENLKHLIETRVNFLTEKQNNTFNDLIFKDKPSQRFFVYLVEKWLKEEVNKTTALRFIFTKMWYKNNDKETPYKIISTQPYFVRDYWNLKYSNIYKFKNPKNPKLNKDSFTDYYHNRFKNLLTEFQGG